MSTPSSRPGRVKPSPTIAMSNRAREPAKAVARIRRFCKGCRRPCPSRRV